MAQKTVQEAFDLVADELDALDGRVDSLEMLGHYLGSFATKAALPGNASAFTGGVTINDFATVRADEDHGGNISRYVVTAIAAGTGALTWTFDFEIAVDDGLGELPSGGTAGQFLKKTGTADYAAGWAGITGDDITVNWR
jgi:hypothetical protein